MIYDVNDILSVLSESTSDYIFDVYDSILFTEGEKTEKLKENFNKAKDKVKTVSDKAMNTKAGKVAKKVGSAAGSVYNGIAETPGAVAAGAVATATAIKNNKSLKGIIPEIQKEYQQRAIKYRSNSKVGVTVAVLLAKGLLLGPPDWIITAIMGFGLGKDTPVNQETRRKLNDLKEKAKTLLNKMKEVATKHKNADSTDKEFTKEYNELLREGNDIAREVDIELRGLKNKPIAVAESTLIDKFDELLIAENGLFVENGFDILSTIVEKTDHDKFDIYPLLERYFEMAI